MRIVEGRSIYRFALARGDRGDAVCILGFYVEDFNFNFGKVLVERGSKGKRI